MPSSGPTSRPNTTAKKFQLPIGFFFPLLKSERRICIWLNDSNHLKYEGNLQGFDHFMNCVLSEVVEIDTKRQIRKELGTLMLKGDAICLIQYAQP